MEQKQFDISWATLWKIAAMIVLMVALFYARSALVMVGVAIIISSALHAPVAYLERKGIPRLLGVLTIFIVGTAIIALLLYTLVPISLIQLRYLLDHINELKIPALESLGTSDVVMQLDKGVGGLIGMLAGGGADFWSVIAAIVGNMFLIGVSLVLSFYMALSRDGVERFIRAVLPTSKEEYVVGLYTRTRHKLGKWLSGQLLLSFIVGALTFIGLVIMGVDYALVLALLAAVLELIPYVGPIVVGIITFLITLPKSLTLAIIAVAVFILIQQIENHVLVPLIMSRAIGVDPVMIVIAMIAGSEISGLVGVVLAVPVVIILQEVADNWSERKRILREKTNG